MRPDLDGRLRHRCRKNILIVFLRDLIDAPRTDPGDGFVASQHPEAVEEAIGLLQNTVYSFSMKVCGHPEDAEDTIQEVLSRSLGHLAKIHNPQALAVRLYTVTRNRCWRLRRKPAHAPGNTTSLDELLPDDAELGRMLQDEAEGPEDHLIHAEQHHLLHKAILNIPAQLRIVLCSTTWRTSQPSKSLRLSDCNPEQFEFACTGHASPCAKR